MGLHVRQRFEPVAIRQRQIQQHDIERALREPIQSRLQPTGNLNLERCVLGEDLLQILRIARVVLDKQNVQLQIVHTGGNLTIVNQKCLMDCTTFSNCCSPTGLVT